MQTSKDVSVGTKKFKVISITPNRALEHYFTLQKYILGPVGDIVKTFTTASDFESFQDKEIDFGAALGRLAESIDPKALTKLMTDLVADGAQKTDGSQIIFEEEFYGDLGTVFGLVKEVVSHNYPNFFGMLLDLIKGLGPVSTLVTPRTNPSSGAPSSTTSLPSRKSKPTGA